MLEKHEGCSYYEALRAAAQKAGFPSYEAAQCAISAGGAAKSLEEMSCGMALFKQGQPAPFFSGGNDLVIAGWFAAKARVKADVKAGRARRVYDSLMQVACTYTRDEGFAETLVMRAMHVLSEKCSPSSGQRLRDYSDDKYFACGDTFGY